MASKTSESSAKDIIGDAAWGKISNAASGASINSTQMRNIAWFLPTDQQNQIGGRHDRRVNDERKSADEEEMKNILADWFHYGDMPDNKAKALEELIKAFEAHGNRPLARELMKIKDNPEAVLLLLLGC